MTLKFPPVVSNPLWPAPKLEAYRPTVRKAYVVPAVAKSTGIPIVHADTVSISDEARAAYRRMTEGSS